MTAYHPIAMTIVIVSCISLLATTNTAPDQVIPEAEYLEDNWKKNLEDEREMLQAKQDDREEQLEARQAAISQLQSKPMVLTGVDKKWKASTRRRRYTRDRKSKKTPAPAPAPVAVAKFVKGHIVVKVADRRNAGSKDKISVRFIDKVDGESTWQILGQNFKNGETRTVPAAVPAAQPEFVQLKSDGKDGLLLSEVSMKIAGEDSYYGPGGQYLMCRKSGMGSETCTFALHKIAKTKGHGATCELPINPPLPKLLTSSFEAPLPGRGDLEIANAELKYSAFTVWLDCTKRSAYRFEYIAYKDCGNLPRHGGFKLDPKFPKSCQQKNGEAYPKTDRGDGVKVAFDRGHLVPANHLDGDALAIKESNYMTNILPQAAFMNRGAWLLSEETIECWRQKEALHVLGGAVWGFAPIDQHSFTGREKWFEKSHYVPYPTYFWKVVTARTLFPEDNHRIAWLMPNSEDAKRSELSSFVVSIEHLEMVLIAHGQPQIFDVPKEQKSKKPAKTWPLPPMCDKSE